MPTLLLEEEGKNKTERIHTNELLLTENIEEIINDNSFFKLPVHKIISIISKVDFSTRNIITLTRLITNMVSSHFAEPETLQLLHKLKKEKLPKLSINECISIFACFANSDICNMLSSLSELPSDVDYDWEYIYKQKEKEIETFKTQISVLKTELEELKNKPKFPPITEEPEILEEDIFDAIMKGDLPSVQWLVEREDVDIDEQLILNITPLMMASHHSDELPEKCYSIVEYLLEKGADINSKAEDGCTALHYAHTLKIAKTLVEHGADIESVNDYGETPLIYHSQEGILNIVKYLLSAGANKTAKNNEGKTAYDVACDTYSNYLRDDKEELKAELQEILK